MSDTLDYIPLKHISTKLSTAKILSLVLVLTIFITPLNGVFISKVSADNSWSELTS